MLEITKYYIDKKKRTVAAILYTSPTCVADEVLTHNLKSMGSFIEAINIDITSAFEVTGKYVGVARCHPEDTFDEKKGMEIARLKALKKYLKEKKKKTESLAAAYEDLARRIKVMDEYTGSALVHVIEKLDSGKN